MTVLLISFKQYDKVSRPNLGEGGPLAGEGAGGVENGGSVEGESLGHRERGGGRGETKVPAPEHEVCRQGLVYRTGRDGGGKKRGQNTIKQVKRERKRQRQHLKAHQKARKTTSEHTKHISPRGINTRTHTHTRHMALPAKKATIKVTSAGKSCSHLISKLLHRCRGWNRVTACARLRECRTHAYV